MEYLLADPEYKKPSHDLGERVLHLTLLSVGFTFALTPLFAVQLIPQDNIEKDADYANDQSAQESRPEILNG